MPVEARPAICYQLPINSTFRQDHSACGRVLGQCSWCLPWISAYFVFSVWSLSPQFAKWYRSFMEQMVHLRPYCSLESPFASCWASDCVSGGSLFDLSSILGPPKNFSYFKQQIFRMLRQWSRKLRLVMINFPIFFLLSCFNYSNFAVWQSIFLRHRFKRHVASQSTVLRELIYDLFARYFQRCSWCVTDLFVSSWRHATLKFRKIPLQRLDLACLDQCL